MNFEAIFMCVKVPQKQVSISFVEIDLLPFFPRHEAFKGVANNINNHFDY